MDIFQIIQTHNRMWSQKELVVFGIIVMCTALILALLLRRGRLRPVQSAAILALELFLGIVFASTVFTRNISPRHLELVPFWSWKEALLSHNWPLFLQIILNCILLIPMGMLLPAVADRYVRPSRAFIAGFMVSAVIEVSQLIWCRGWFEWDDMIHNALGCMVGCMLSNRLRRILAAMWPCQSTKQRT